MRCLGSVSNIVNVQFELFMGYQLFSVLIDTLYSQINLIFDKSTG
jgi:hypothetical protein